MGEPILTQSRIYNLQTVTFPTQSARFIKYENKVNIPQWWGFWNVNVFNTAGSTEIDTGDNVNLALNKPTTGSTLKNANLSNDGDSLTGNDGSVFQVDLGASYDIRRIHIKENAGFNSFMILVSTSEDGVKWTP